jgi:CheY-like chemotaxis protein
MDSSADTLDLLRHYLEFRGFEVETCNLARLRQEHVDIADAVVSARPDVIVFDIALPYEVNWQICSSLQQDPRVRAPFVLTTTNRAAVERLTGARGVVEIFGKPYDLEQFAETVRQAVHAADPEHAGGTTPHGNVRRGPDRRTGDRRREERRRNHSTD